LEQLELVPQRQRRGGRSRPVAAPRENEEEDQGGEPKAGEARRQEEDGDEALQDRLGNTAHQGPYAQEDCGSPEDARSSLGPELPGGFAPTTIVDVSA
jgi:hypothetical protein